MEKSKLMKLNEVLSDTKMGKTKLYRLIKQGRFPSQLQHGDGSVVWARLHVEAWIDNLIGKVNEPRKF
jgi:prophage regulatory protein